MVNRRTRRAPRRAIEDYPGIIGTRAAAVVILY